MGTPHNGPTIPTGAPNEIPAGKLALGSFAGDFQLVAAEAPAGPPVRVTNKELPVTPTPYVIADGGGDRFGGNVFLARNANTNGQFLFIMTEGGPGGGVGAHFHARHFENFYGFDGETLGWAQGKAVALHTGDYFQAPPRNLHGFRLNQAYNRFAAFLTPGSSSRSLWPAADAGACGWRGRTRRWRCRRRRRTRRRGRRGGGAPGPEMFRFLQMSGRGSDGYPLDVHGASFRCRRRIRSGRRPSPRMACRSAPRSSRTHSCSAAFRSVARSRPNSGKPWRSNRARWISCEGEPPAPRPRAGGLALGAGRFRPRRRPRSNSRR